ncbi:MAG: protein kinase [Phycisphaerae bacterium]
MADTWDQQDTGQRPDDSRENQRRDETDSFLARSNGVPSGTGLGKYRVLERLRTTHNAIIYKGRDTMLDRPVAIKQMNPRLIDDPTACGEFKREAQLLARVPKDARNVIHIHELIETNRGLFIIEQFVPGDWLETLISKHLVDVTDSVRLLKSACVGLQSLHGRRIVHRDIQPSNLLVTKHGQARITNLACATHEGDDAPPPVIRNKYAAPELQRGAPHDARADIYALGMVMYEICVGRKALHAHFSHFDDPEDWRRWHTDGSTALPEAVALNPKVPPVLSAILARMTAKNLDERFASVLELFETLLAQFDIRAAPALAAQSGPRILEIRTIVPTLQQDLIGRAGAWPPLELRHLPAVGQHDQSTSTRPAAPSILSDNADREAGDRGPEPDWRPLPPARPLRRRRIEPRPAAVFPMVRDRLAARNGVPRPLKTTDPPHKRRRVLLPAVIALSLFGLVFLIAPMLWDRAFGEPHDRECDRALADGHAAYRSGHFGLAQASFQEAAILSYGNLKLGSKRVEAELMLLLIKGQLALNRNDFATVERILALAEKRGANASATEALRERFWNRKDASRLAAEGIRELEQNAFASVELKLEEYERKAGAAGLDPTTLRRQYESRMQDLSFEGAMKRARQALAEHRYEDAERACRSAERIETNSETRQLFSDIHRSRQRDELVLRGDHAMRAGAYQEAETAYQAANQIKPSIRVEQKVRIAASARLQEEAREAIDRGDLIDAQRLLNRSLFKYPNPAARETLERMKPAFEAARLARRADRERAARHYDEAIRLYTEALPRLPSPADQLVRDKLAKTRMAATQPFGQTP